MKKIRFYKKKITKLVLSVLALMTIILGIPGTIAGSTYTNLSPEAPSSGVVDKLTVRAFKCSQTAIEGMTGQPIPNDMQLAGMCTSMLGTALPFANYEINDGDSVDPGTVVAVLLSYDYEGGGNSVISNMNTRLLINESLMEVVSLPNGTPFTVAQDTWYPVDTTYDYSTWPVTEKKENKFTLTHSYDAVNKAILTQWDYKTSGSVLNNHQNLVFYAVKIKDDASAGTTFEFKLGPQATHTDVSYSAISSGNTSKNDGNGRVYVQSNSVSAKVTGGSTSSDNTLGALTVKYNADTYTVDSSTPFTAGDKTNKTYLYYVPNGTADIDIKAVANDAKVLSVVAQDSDNNIITDLDATDKTFDSEDTPISVGMNSFTIAVTAQNGDVETYTVNVYRLSNDTSVSSITTDGITLTKKSGETATAVTYTGTTNFDDADTVIRVTPTHQNAVVAAGNGTTTGAGNWTFTQSGDNINERKVTVQAENCKSEYASINGNSCTSKVYTIQISRTAASNVATLSGITVDGTALGGFNSGVKTYNYGNVAANKASVTIAATLTDTRGTIVSGTGTCSLTVGDNTCKIKTKAQDNTTTDEYTINIHRLSNEIKLQSLTVTANPTGTMTPPFNSDNTNNPYTYSYDASTSTVTIAASVKDTGKATIAIVDATRGAPNPSTVSFVANNTSQSFALPATTAVAILVTAEDGTVNTYTVNLSRKTSSNNYLSNFTITYQDGSTQTVNYSPTFNASTRNYTAKVPAHITEVDIAATKAVTFSKITKIGDSTGTDLTTGKKSNLVFGTNQIQITVLNESGNDNTYTITLTREKYGIKTLDALNLGSGFTTPFASTTYEYTYVENVPYGTNKLRLTGTKTNSYATVSAILKDEKSTSTPIMISESTTDDTFEAEVTIPTGANQIILTVSAQDGTKQEYKINVTRTKNNDNSVKSITVTDQTSAPTVDETDDSVYYVIVPYNKTSVQAAEVAVGIGTGAQLSKGGAVTDLSTTTSKDFTFTITAEDGTPKNYTLKILRAPNAEAKITKVTLSIAGSTPGATAECRFEGESKSCTINVPTDTTGFIDTVEKSDGSSLVPNDSQNYTMPSTDSTKEIVYAVTSQDGRTTNTYTVTVNRAKSSVTTLSNLQIDSEQVSGFTPSNNLYTATKPGTTTKVKVTATVTEVGKQQVIRATVKGTPVTITGTKAGGVFEFDADLDFGDNAVVITVEAENSQTQNYNLTITRQKRNDATLSNLDYKVGPDGSYNSVPSFIPGTGSYTLPSVGYDDTYITIKATPNDEFGIAQVTEVKNEKGQVTASNIADLDSSDGKVYTGKVNLSTGTNTIVVTATAHNGTTTKTYTLTITRAKNASVDFENLKVKNVEAVEDPEDPSGKTYMVTLPNGVTSIDTTADISVTLPDGATVAYNPTSIATLSTTGVNTITMSVTSESGSTENYTINITREKSTVTTLTRAKVDITSTVSSENGELICDFSGTKECTFNAPTNTNGFTLKLEGAALEAGSTDPAVPKTYVMDAENSKIEIPITVTAEDGVTTDAYKVIVNRSKSSNNNLIDISYKYSESDVFQTVTGFIPSTTLYRLAVNGDTDKIWLNAVVQDTGKAKINTELAYPFDVALGRQTQIEIEVEAENGSKIKYYVIVTRARRNDASLSMIKINDTDLGEFVKDTLEYTLASVPYGTTYIDVAGILNDQDEDSNATVSGGGRKYLTTGNNVIELVVTADDGTTKRTYKLNVEREKNNSTAVNSITLAGNNATYNETEGVWEVSVPNSINQADSTNVVVTPAPGATASDPLATVSIPTVSLGTTVPTDVTISVTAEDGTAGTVVLRVERAKSNISTLHTLTVDGGSFAPSFVPDARPSGHYRVTIPESYTSITIGATATDPNATVVGAGTFNFAGNTTFPVNVTSEDGSDTTAYYLDIVRSTSSVNTLKSITVSSGDPLSPAYTTYVLKATEDNSEGFTPDKTSYTVTIPGNISTINIAAEPTDPRAKITNADAVLGNKTISVGRHTYTIRVESESGASQSYTLIIEREAKPFNQLTALTVDDIDIDGFSPDVLDYTLPDVENTKASVVIGGTLADEDSSVTGFGTCDLRVGDNTCKVEVTAQNGEKRTYRINIARKASDENRLSALSVQGYLLTPVFNADVEEYEVTVRANKLTLAPTEVTAIAKDATAVVTKDPEITLVSNEFVSYKVTVTSATGRAKVYTIRVKKPYSSDATLKNVTLTNATLSGTITTGTLAYTIYVPRGTESFSIAGVPTVTSTQVISGDATYNLAELRQGLSEGENPKVYITTLAEDNTTSLTYEFTIEESLSNDATLSTLYVDGYPFIAPNISFSQAITAYSIGDIDFSVDGVNVVAAATNTGSTIRYYVNGSLQNNNEVEIPPTLGSGSITVRVTAPDGRTTKAYTIAFNKVYSTNARLAHLATSVGTLSPNFIKTTLNYVVTVGEEVDSLDLTMYTEDTNAFMYVDGNPTAVSGNLVTPYVYTKTGLTTGDNLVSIVVNPQDTSATGLTYNVIIRKSEPAANSDATLQALSVDDYPFVSMSGYTTTTFAKDTTDYHIGKINLKVNKLKVNYEVTQSASTVKFLVGGVQVSPNSEGYITIPEVETSNGIITVQVTAPNSTSTMNYNIHYIKEASSNAFLSSLVVASGTLDQPFNRETYSYIDTVGDDVMSETITVTPEVNTVSITINGEHGQTFNTFPAVYTLSGITPGTTRVPVVVTAENGNIISYYIDVYKEGSGELITSDVHGHTIENGVIKTIAPDKTVLDIKNELDNDNSKLEIWTADDTSVVPDSDPVGTGMIVKLLINGIENDRKLIVIKGDTNGDGEVGLQDVVIALNHFLGNSTLTGAYLDAGDVNDDTSTDLSDVVIILNHFLGNSSISTYR